MNIFLLIFSLFFLLLSLKNIYLGRFYYLSVFVTSSYFLFMSLIFLGIVDYSGDNIWASSINFNSEILFYYNFFILSFVYFSVFLSEVLLGRRRYIFDYRTLLIKVKNSERYLLLLSIFIFFYWVSHLICLDMQALWSSSEYLYINSVDALDYKNNFSFFIQKSSSLVGLISIVILSIALVLRRWKVFLIIFIPAIFYLLLKVGEHSRLSVLYLIAVSFIFLFFGNKFHKLILLPISCLFSLFNLVNSLYGRGLGNHGFSALSNYFPNIIDSISRGNGILYSLGNFFQGAYVHSESISYLGYEYPIIFKILSFSPFPSVVDGFSDKAIIYSLRINQFVPMGATGELLIFGIQYIFLYFLLIFVCIYRNVLDFKKGNFLILSICMLFVVVGLFLHYTYPIRNVIKFYYIALFISISAPYIIRK